MTGRPSTYTQEIGEEFCRRYAAGRHITDICKDEDMPSRDCIYDWRNNIETFGLMFTRAQEKHADALVETATDIVDTEHDAQRAKIRRDHRVWLASKFNRDKYGEKIDVNHKTTIQVTLAIEEAGQRVRSIRDQSDIIEIQAIDIAGHKQYIASDTQSDDDDIFS